MNRASSLALIGGHAALNFSNTVGWHAGPDRIESLASYQDLLDWSVHAGVLTGPDAASLARQAGKHPVAARQALAYAIRARELIFRTFTSVAQDNSPAGSDLEQLHAAWLDALEHAIAAWSDGLIISFAGSGDLRRPVYPLVLDAVDLLRSPDRARVRQCANDPCGWLFVDRSKNQSRRWCSSGDCGNEIRVRRFRQKRR